MPIFESPRRKDFMELNGKFILLYNRTFINLHVLDTAKSSYVIDLYVVGDTARPVRVARFHLPERASGRWISEWAGRIQLTAWPTRQSYLSERANGEPPSRLEVLPSTSILIVNHSIFRRSGEVTSVFRKDPPPSNLHLCYLIRVLPFVRAAEAYRTGKTVAGDVAWSQWGSSNSRTIQRPDYVVGNGSRVLIVNGEEERVWEFNPVSASQDDLPCQSMTNSPSCTDERNPKTRSISSWWRRKTSSTPQCRSRPVKDTRSIRLVGADQRTIVPHGGFLASDVVGRLPYYEMFCPSLPEGGDTPCHALLHGSPLIAVGHRRNEDDPQVRGVVFESPRGVADRTCALCCQRKLYALDL